MPFCLFREVEIWRSRAGSVCQRAFAPDSQVPRLCAIWTPQCGGMKGKLCFIKRKSKSLVSNNRIFREKMFYFFGTGRSRTKTCGLSCETSLIFSSSSPFFWKRRTLLPFSAIRRFLLRSFVRANGHAPAHRALSEFAIPAFTLHLHPQPVDTVCFACEGMCPFLPSPVKERGVKPSPASR